MPAKNDTIILSRVQIFNTGKKESHFVCCDPMQGGRITKKKRCHLLSNAHSCWDTNGTSLQTVSISKQFLKSKNKIKRQKIHQPQLVLPLICWTRQKIQHHRTFCILGIWIEASYLKVKKQVEGLYSTKHKKRKWAQSCTVRAGPVPEPPQQEWGATFGFSKGCSGGQTGIFLCFQ